MTLDDVYIAGVGAWLPPRRSAPDALAAGETDPAILRLTGATAVAVATGADETPAEMGGRAARAALGASGLEPAEISLVLHASTYDQQHDMWAPASYVQRTAVGNRCPAIDVGQVSNGGMAALELAVSYLRGGPGRRSALISTGDRFRAPGFDRWRSDPGTVYGDGGTALVLSTAGGFARLRSLALDSDPHLEGMHRPGPVDGPAPVPEPGPRTVDLGGAAKGFLGQVGHSFAVSRMAAAQRDVVKRALADAETTLDEIDHVVVPHFGRRRLESSFLRPLGIDPDRTTWSWSRSVGHLGAGDQFAGLDRLRITGALRAGQRCLLLGVGAGFSWSAAVLDVTSTPPVSFE